MVGVPHSLRFRPQEFVSVFRRLFWREAVARSVFGYHARDEKVQEIIFATRLGAAAAHFESTKGMTSNDRAGARAIDIHISRLQLRFDTLDVCRATRQKSASQRVIGAIGHLDRFVEIAHFYYAQHRPENFFARDAHIWL